MDRGSGSPKLAGVDPLLGDLDKQPLGDSWCRVASEADEATCGI